MAAASMAASTVSKAVLFQSNDAAASAVFSSKPSSLKFHCKPVVGTSYRSVGSRRTGNRVVAMSSPPPAKENLSATENMAEKVKESIQSAMETCEGDNTSKECVASWDTVEELSATQSDLRNKAKSIDPLEEFCKDNPETEECRTYED